MAAAVKSYVPYSKVIGLAERIAKKLDGRDYDVVLAVANGGLAPAQLIYDRLRAGNPKLTVGSVQLKRYKGMRGGKVEFVNFSPELLRGKRLLVCEEIVDEGATLAALSKRLASLRCVAEYAALFVKEGASFRPDYLGRIVPRTVRSGKRRLQNWLVFPWDKEYGRRRR